MDPQLQQLAKEALEEAERDARQSWPWRIGHREGLAEGIEQGIEQGRLEALREAVWLIVELRDLAVEDSDRARVEACRDPDQLHRWLIRLKAVERFADALGD